METDRTSPEHRMEVPAGTPLGKFLSDQLSQWKEASASYRALKRVERRTENIGGLEVEVVLNTERWRSATAETSGEAVASRPCFLCESNRPEQQMFLPFEGRKGRDYQIVLNPYPIFPQHIVVVRSVHSPQSIWNNYVDMTDLAHHYPGYTFFYNGPCCGASAPDHFHFQGCPGGVLPLEKAAQDLMDRLDPLEEGVPNGEERVRVPEEMSGDIEYLCSVQEAQLFHYKHFARGVFFLRARTSKSISKLFYKLLDAYPTPEGEDEPRFNLLTWYKGEGKRPRGSTHGLSPFEYRAIVVLRTEHRPSCFYAPQGERILLSPGCADMAGYFVTVRGEDFGRLRGDVLRKAVEDVTLTSDQEGAILRRLTRTQPVLQVGIMSGDEIHFEIISDGAGPQKVSYQEGKIAYNGALYDELLFGEQTPSTIFAQPSFILHGVTIGVDFHWQRRLTQTFAGSLKFIVLDGKVQAVNLIGVEDYLLSVISSEMKSSATEEFLKAHAVISRSWVLSQIRSRRNRGPALSEELARRLNSTPALVTELSRREGADSIDNDPASGEEEYIRWFDHDDHDRFDVCADDHCQRYQGIGMAVGDKVRHAIDQTWGQVLAYGGEVCDCRFYKSCGGTTEKFSVCWADVDYPYLPALPDTPGHDPHGHCFCDTHDQAILSQVLNDYDLETSDFYEWRVEYTRQEISDLVRERSGIDFGTILDLVPLSVGASGRIYRLRVVGTKKTLVIGKELIIRRFLSTSHLKSSAFTVAWTPDDRLVLEGRGWGHGVGLCQIGAAVMAYSGYTYGQILEHYYPHAELVPLEELDS